MNASTALQRCLEPALGSMHALRRRVLLGAADALIAGRRLTLMDVARSWPGAERVRAPLKALDLLLSNRHLQVEREQVYAGTARCVVRMASEAAGIDRWLSPFRSNRRLYSVRRLGREALARRWLCMAIGELIDRISHPDVQLLDQIGVPA